ncbi:MAG: NHLP bacteriocin export ABC transporter permease/ATPase subunit [Gemmatimonadota bacterium]
MRQARSDLIQPQLSDAALPGAVRTLPGNTPLPLDDPDTLWVVLKGEVDIFFAEKRPDGEFGPLHFLTTLWANEVVLGGGTTDGTATLIAVAAGAARIRAVPESALDDHSGWSAPLAERVAETFARAMAATSHGPVVDIELDAEPLSLQRAASVGAPRAVCWISASDGELAFANDVPLEASAALPLARGMWYSVTSAKATLTAVSTENALAHGNVRPALKIVRGAFLSWAAKGTASAMQADRERLRRKADQERELEALSMTGLASVLGTSRGAAPPLLETSDPLLAACRLVGDSARIVFRAPPSWEESGRWRDRLGAICRASRVRHRRVVLRGEWWSTDCGPLLAYRSEGNAPVALLSSVEGIYTLRDPATGTSEIVTKEVAGTLEAVGYMFYRPAPSGPIDLKVLARVAGIEAWIDLRRVLLFAVASSLLSLALPISTQKIFDAVIPSAQISNALALFGALAGMAIGGGLVDLARAMALVRFEGRSNATLQAALVDRLFALPVPFFRRFSVGDLSLRAGAINGVRELLSGAAITALLGGMLVVANLFLMIKYSGKLALVALGVFVVSVLVTGALGVHTLRLERQRQEIQGRVGALLFQILGGIAKLRVAAAERRAFAVWGAIFRDQKAVSYRMGLSQAAVTVFNETLPTVAAIVLFLVFISGSDAGAGQTLSTGDFMAFYAAFGAFLTAGTQMSTTAVSLLNIIPMLERARPILVTPPEVDELKPDPGLLTGRIEVSHVTFRYLADGPPILSDVSFQIRPGEFVAFVGASGAGKSTILRLLLGFERPERGAVIFDGQDLSSVDVSAVRSQCAVVLQQSRILAGDIFTNIAGAAPLSLDDVWEAAEMAGLANDIRLMPMGMHTVLSEGATALSGGQRQRLLIARALVKKPRIIFFDEATSALDNRTQETVSKSLERLQATRVVIAHRLSTIRNADRIFSMHEGRIVEEGRYEDLVARDGLFAKLAARQTT